MTRTSIILILLITAAWQPGCSGCSNGNGATADGGTDTSTTDGDTDTDTDSDTDSDTDTDTGVPDWFVPDAGPWEWEDLPDAGDCGQEGCRQLTFGDGVDFLEWDVWGGILSYDGEPIGLMVVDVAQGKQVRVPSPISTTTAQYSFFPATVYEEKVCYGRSATYLNGTRAVICADLQTEIQKLIYYRQKEGDDFPQPAMYSDLYGTRFVSTGGCGEVMDSKPLCVFDLDAPGTYEEDFPPAWGGYNTIWEDVSVWFGADGDGILGDYDVRGRYITSGEYIDIAVDDEVQAFPRIKGTKVVYMDLRFGDSGYAGDWNHAAIFMYDLVSHETTQITDGSAIAIDPDLDGDIVVWMDYRACPDPNGSYESYYCAEVWGYNLDTETEFQVTNLPGRMKQTPRIWGDKVFIQMSKVGGGDAIYMFDLPDGAK